MPRGRPKALQLGMKSLASISLLCKGMNVASWWGRVTTCQEGEVVKVQELRVTSSQRWGHRSSADGAKGSTHLLAQDRRAAGRLSSPVSRNRHLRGPKRSPEWLHFMLICLTMCQGLTHRQGHKDSEKDLVWQIPNGLWGSRWPVTSPPPHHMSIFKWYFQSPGSCILSTSQLLLRCELLPLLVWGSRSCLGRSPSFALY